MSIEILEVIENEDGTCSVSFDYDEEFTEMVKKELEKEEVSEEDIAQYVVEAIDKGVISIENGLKEE